VTSIDLFTWYDNYYIKDIEKEELMTDYVKLTGMAYWARLQSPDTKYLPPKFKVCLYLNDDNMKAFRATGMGLRPKTDDKGTFITLTRPVTKMFGGKEQEFGPPEVLDSSNKPFDGYVGNGSHIECTVAVYNTPLGKGHRLQRVKVLDLVEYVPATDAIPFSS
jgi:hypothetical protein